MGRLFIVRHGNTFDAGDVVRRVGRRTDLALSVSGREQAAALGRYFAALTSRIDAIFAAPLRRTLETAEIIRSDINKDLPVERRADLSEIDYGPDENQPEDVVLARIGAEAMRRWNEDAAPPHGWDVDPAALTDSWRALFKEVAAGSEDTGALAVTSNGVARFALDAADHRPSNAPRKLRTGAFGVVDLSLNAAGDVAAIIAGWDLRPGEVSGG